MVKRIVPLLPVAAFPFTIWLALGMMGPEPPPVNPLLLIVLFWLLGLAGAVIVFLQAVRGKRQGRKLALASMLVKLLHIQNYVVLFFVAMLTFVFAALTILVWIFDVMTIFLTGVVGLAAVVRCRMEGRLTTKAAIVNGILQFVFCADVFSAIWVYRNSKEAFLS